MEAKAGGREKRQAPRVQLRCRLRYRVIPGNEARLQDGFAQDVSQTGFRFYSTEFIPKQTSLIVKMEHLGHATIRSVAQAVWIRERPLDGGYEVGGRFVEPPSNSRTTLTKLTAGR
jgi:hypothetical protein